MKRTALVCVLAVLGVWGCGRDTEQPNVLLISIDTCRADRLSCYGYARSTTPTLDALARQGIRFTNARSPVPLTLPAHSSMLTGLMPPAHGVRDNQGYRLPGRCATLAGVLRAAGYTTGAVVASFVLDSVTGLDRGFDSYHDRFGAEVAGENISQRRGDEVTRLALQWLDRARDDRFFLFLHYFDPHAQYAPPEPFASAFSDDPYTGEIAFVDHCIGQVLGHLRTRGLFEQTLIIVTADHGEMLGEHGEFSHGYFIYRSALHVPLIVKLPGQVAGRVVSSPVSIADIPATVLDCTGLGMGPGMGGTSLAGRVPRARPMYCESLLPATCGCAPLQGIVAGQWKYIQAPRPELYCLARDPGETDNLAGDAPDRVRDLAEALQELQRGFGDAAPEARRAADARTTRRLRALGYVAGPVRSSPAAAADPKDRIGLHVDATRIGALLLHAEYDRARGIATALLERYPDVPVVYSLLGDIAARTQAPVRAARWFQRGLELAPDDAGLHADLAAVLERQGAAEAAVAQYRQSLRLQPDQFVVHVNLGRLLARQGDLEAARSHWRQALQRNPDLTVVRYNIALSFSQQGRWEPAQQAWQDLRDRHPRDPVVYLHLAEALEALGDGAGAARAARQGLACLRETGGEGTPEALAQGLRQYAVPAGSTDVGPGHAGQIQP